MQEYNENEESYSKALCEIENWFAFDVPKYVEYAELGYEEGDVYPGVMFYLPEDFDMDSDALNPHHERGHELLVALIEEYPLKNWIIICQRYDEHTCSIEMNFKDE